MSDIEYRTLQQKLDTHPVGFPPSTRDEDVRLLKHIFTPREAAVVSRLDWHYQSVADVLTSVSDLVRSESELSELLHNVLSKGGVNFRRREGVELWAIAPLVVGMYEYQVERMSKEFVDDLGGYQKNRRPVSDARRNRPGQMRVIPIRESVTPDLRIGSFEDIAELVRSAGKSIALLTCVCRKKSEMLGHSCERTDRAESCMAFLDFAEQSIEQGIGRRATREEALEALEMSRREGLVFSPSNSQQAQFVCSCCPDCCGLLRGLRMTEEPATIALSNFRAVVNAETCAACGSCAEMCPMDAIDLSAGTATVADSRCIGCGVCVVQCETGSIVLERKPESIVPPETLDDLYELYDEQRRAVEP